jgi:large subunit ribosomal protein L24
MNKWIKKGDKVVVIAGNDKGRTGSVLSRKGERILIQGINIRKKHAKRKTPAATKDIMEIEVPIHISNVSICNDDGKPVKLKIRSGSDGNKELFYVDGSKEIVYRQVKKNT